MHTFEIPLYEYDLTISIYQVSLRKSIRECGFYYSKEMDKFDTISMFTKSGQFYMFLPVDCEPGQIASLALKTVSQIFEHEGINISSEQIAHQSRLIEWIVNNVHAVLNGTKIKTNYITSKGGPLSN